MAAPGGKYFIQNKFGARPSVHHQSFELLWETKWKFPASIGVYPFMFGAAIDFEPVVARLISEGQKESYDWDAYAEAFFPKAEELVGRAVEAEARSSLEEASELYLRASAVYRIARFPFIRSPKQRHAWTENKRTCLRGLALSAYPSTEVHIPFTSAGWKDGHIIPVYQHVPPVASASNPVPCLIILTGLDGYRTELSVWRTGFSQLGIATLVLEIPGTGDSPADPTDPLAADRMFDSLLAWIKTQQHFDSSKLLVWGFSTGGYQVIRLAHTHPTSFLGLVAHGGGAHYMFDPEWLDYTLGGEYPFDLATSLAEKFGYGKDYARFKAEGSAKWSLLEDGTLDKPCGRLLLVNGVGDEIFPVDDCFLCLCKGEPKEARFVVDKGHMGEPESFAVILKWIYGLLGIENEPAEQLKTLLFQPRWA